MASWCSPILNNGSETEAYFPGALSLGHVHQLKCSQGCRSAVLDLCREGIPSNRAEPRQGKASEMTLKVLVTQPCLDADGKLRRASVS